MRQEPGKQSADRVPGGCGRCPLTGLSLSQSPADKTRTWPGGGCGSAGTAGTIELSC